MAKKRKQEVRNSELPKHTPVEVVVQDVTTHPLCLHGPTLLFSSEKGRYYGCSSCRNKKDCTIHIDEEDWMKESVKKRNEKYYSLIPKIDKIAAWKNFNEVKSRHPSDRAYCNNCKDLYIFSQSKRHNGKDHTIITPLSDDQLAQPSSWLPTLENDSVEAQYMFSKASVNAVLGILKNNNIHNILCVGTPSIHEAATAHTDFNSLLLDYDTRHHQFQAPTKYIWYNMFNNYMFNGNEDEKVLKKFFKNAKNGLCIVMDPPFGGRVEPLAHTLQELSAAYNKICDKADDKLIPIIWAFPYFSEPYIVNILPELKMHDFQVAYVNHKKFQNKSTGRKFGSPVRLFTNLPFSTIDLSNDTHYKKCDKCKYWVSVGNTHCNKCGECTSKNGMTYKHCNACKRCVKPTFFHCSKCARCCLEKGHVCGVIVESQSCYNCNEKGHKISQCPSATKATKKKRLSSIK